MPFPSLSVKVGVEEILLPLYSKLGQPGQRLGGRKSRWRKREHSAGAAGQVHAHDPWGRPAHGLCLLPFTPSPLALSMDRPCSLLLTNRAQQTESDCGFMWVTTSWTVAIPTLRGALSFAAFGEESCHCCELSVQNVAWQVVQGSLWQPANRKLKFSNLQLRGLECCQQPEWAQKWSLLHMILDEPRTPDNTLITAFETLARRPSPDA